MVVVDSSCLPWGFYAYMGIGVQELLVVLLGTTLLRSGHGALRTPS